MKLQLVNDTNEVAKEIDLPSGSSFILTYNGAYGVLSDTTNLDYMKFDDKHVMRQGYRQMASQLINKYGAYLYNVYARDIAFIVDEAWVPSEKASKNSAWKIDIAKAPAWLRMLTGFEYMIKMRQHWLEEWSVAQVHAAIMSQLLRINPEDGNVIRYNEDFHSKLVATFGIGYLEPYTVIPDLLKEQVRIIGFREASGQITIDELPVNEPETALDDSTDRCGACVNWCKTGADMGSCNAEMEPGAVADSHPACEEFYPAYPLSEVPSDQDELDDQGLGDELDNDLDDGLTDIVDDDLADNQEDGGDHGDAA